jgi:N-formylmaleamate deformylase
MSRQDRFYIEVNGVKLHVLQYGSAGPDLLLLPGITSPAITWGFVAERLAAVARVVVMDSRGRGLSDQRSGLGHTTGDYAGDAAGVIEALAMAPSVVLGHSMGARTAARLCAERPELVSRCILADPPVSGPGRRQYPSPLQKYLDEIDRGARGEAIATRPSFTAEQARLKREWLPTCNKEAVTLSHKAFHEEDLFADLERITCETLLLQAGSGDVIRDTDAEEMIAALKRGTRVKIEHAGPMIPFDALDDFLKAAVPFIQGR